MADKAYLWSALFTVLFSMLRSSALESYQCAFEEFKCLDGMCVLDENFCSNHKPENSFPKYIYVLIGIFGFLVFGCLLLACYKACTNDSDFVNEPPRMGFKPGRILPPESRPVLSSHIGTSSNYQSTGSSQYAYTCQGHQRVAPGFMAQGTHGIQPAVSGYGPAGINSTLRLNQPAVSGYGPAGINSTFRLNQPAVSGYGPAGASSTFRLNQPAVSVYGPAGASSTFQPNQPAMSGYRSDGRCGDAMATFPPALS